MTKTTPFADILKILHFKVILKLSIIIHIQRVFSSKIAFKISIWNLIFLFSCFFFNWNVILITKMLHGIGTTLHSSNVDVSWATPLLYSTLQPTLGCYMQTSSYLSIFCLWILLGFSFISAKAFHPCILPFNAGILYLTTKDILM